MMTKGTLDLVTSTLDNTEDPNLRDVVEGVRQWLTADDDDDRFGDAYADDVQLAGYAIFSRFSGARDIGNQWAQAKTTTDPNPLRRAIRLCIAAKKFVLVDFRRPNDLLSHQRLEVLDTEADYMLPYRLESLIDLAPKLFSKEQRKEAIADIPQFEALHPSSQVNLYLIGDSPPGLDAIAARAAADPKELQRLRDVLHATRRLMSNMRDPEAFEALATKASSWTFLFGGARAVANILVNIPPPTLVRTFVDLMAAIESTANPGDKKDILLLAACLDDEEIATLFATRAHIKNLTPIVADYFERLPHHLPILENVATTAKGKLKVAAAAIVEAVVRRTTTSRAKPDLTEDDDDDDDEIPAILRASSGDATAKLAVVPTISLDALRAAPVPFKGKLPKVANAGGLPPLLLLRSRKALPASAVERLFRLLVALPKSAPHPCVGAIKGAVTTESLDVFVWTLVSDWALAGAHAKDDWILYAAGQLGSDALARKLDAQLTTWINHGKVDVMQKGLDVLALIGASSASSSSSPSLATSMALALLYERGMRARYDDTRDRVKVLLETVAARFGLTYGELEDRLVPTLGLTNDAPLVLDFGPRQFLVKLDEHLVPYLVNAQKTNERIGQKLPRVTKKDDAVKAQDSKARFESLTDDLERMASLQIFRLERAMREGRTWRINDFEQLIVTHPLLRHLATKLIWQIEGTTSLFRVAEDGTLADENDAEMTTAATAACALVKIAHPIDLRNTASWKAMAKVFSDYEILQPFPQVAREVMTKADLDDENVRGRTVPYARVIDLLQRGWRRGSPLEGIGHRGLTLALDPAGHSAVTLTLAPGLTFGDVKAKPAQTIVRVDIRGTTFDALPPRVTSEIVRDVATL